MLKYRLCWKIVQVLVGISLILILYALFNHPDRFQRAKPDGLIQVHEVLENGAISHPVLVSVYYEALCPDSRSFVMKQLKPAYEKGARIMDVELIPYGKAETKVFGQRYEFECQHSVVECEANKIHACGIYYIPKPLEQIRYISCMIHDNSEPHRVGSECAEELGIDYGPIRACATTSKGSQLLKEHGDRTHELSPKPSFIPTVVIDNSRDISSLPALLKNLFGEVCKQFKGRTVPSECESLQSDS